MFLNSVFSTLIGAGLLLVFTRSVHTTPVSSPDGQGDVQQAVINLRQSIQSIVRQTAQGLDVADLQKDISAINTAATELRNTHRGTFAESLESYDEARALKTLLSGTLRKAIVQNPDVTAMILGHDPASGSGGKLALAIDMAGLLEKELGENVTSINKDTSVPTLLTLSEAVMNTVDWMNEAVYNFVESLGSTDGEQSDEQRIKSRQKRDWGFGGYGIQYTRGDWSFSAGPTYTDGNIGGRFRFRLTF